MAGNPFRPVQAGIAYAAGKGALEAGKTARNILGMDTAGDKRAESPAERLAEEQIKKANARFQKAESRVDSIKELVNRDTNTKRYGTPGDNTPIWEL